MMSPSDSPAHILAVDDDSGVLLLIEALFSSRGHSVRTASSGVEALARIDELEPDLIVLDLGMPDMDGVAIFRELRRRSQAAVLFITGYAPSDLESEAWVKQLPERASAVAAEIRFTAAERGCLVACPSAESRPIEEALRDSDLAIVATGSFGEALVSFSPAPGRVVLLEIAGLTRAWALDRLTPPLVAALADAASKGRALAAEPSLIHKTGNFEEIVRASERILAARRNRN